ncbi:MAG: hypothetical protein HGA78_03560 [Nitrospirales bacterium]|nr:hypothetical protein [Nitrospirales bacterium]
MKKLIALHMHWCIADSIKQFVSAELPDSGRTALAPEFQAIGEFHSRFHRLSTWYALLYVVVEGYRELQLQDEQIDALLGQEELVDALRRFRNAIFHYQENPMSEKILGFLEAKKSEVWSHKLNAAFKAFFERVLPIKSQIEEWGAYAQQGALSDAKNRRG